MFREIRAFRGAPPLAALTGILALAVPAVTHAQVSPSVERSAIRLGQQAPSVAIGGTVWLQVQHKAELDAAVKAMYTKGSPTYRKFAEATALARYAPTAAQMEAVKKELAAHHLTVVSTDPQNFAVRVVGQTSDFESAFHTTVEQYRTAKGQTMTDLAAKPALTGAAAGMVQAVTGISRSVMTPFIKVPYDARTGKQIGLVKVSSVSNPSGAIFSPNCFYMPNTTALTTPGQPYPDALYYGVGYGAPPANTKRGTLSPCGYSPSDFASLYGLTAAHAAGYKGKGQTIAIVDAYGSPTLASDVASFDQIYKLRAPKLTIEQTAPITGANVGWAEETTLDVEWAHAVAPQAKILLVNTPTAYNTDLQAGVLSIIENKSATIISNSYGLGELLSSLQDLTTWDEICELASFEGITVNAATGDDGDLYAAEKLSSTDVSSPADSPFATAVGGTSAGFSPVDGSLLQTGWGNNATLLGTAAGPTTPPQQLGFLGGAGGGASQVFAKPAYQASIQGSGRMLPDVSALADPQTGVEIIFTETVNGEAGQYYVLIGGTSLATPIFSAEWALLQELSGEDLGQAAPVVAEEASTGAVTDVLPPPDQYSTYGATLTAAGITQYSAVELIAPETASPFLGAIYNAGGGTYYDLSFGTDSSLPVTTGWDEVTGWGTLNMAGIFNAATSAQ